MDQFKVYPRDLLTPRLTKEEEDKDGKSSYFLLERSLRVTNPLK